MWFQKFTLFSTFMQIIFTFLSHFEARDPDPGPKSHICVIFLVIFFSYSCICLGWGPCPFRNLWNPNVLLPRRGYWNLVHLLDPVSRITFKTLYMIILASLSCQGKICYVVLRITITRETSCVVCFRNFMNLNCVLFICLMFTWFQIIWKSLKIRWFCTLTWFSNVSHIISIF